MRIVRFILVAIGEENPLIDPLLLSYIVRVPERLACERSGFNAVVVEDHLEADGTGVLNDFVHALQRGLCFVRAGNQTKQRRVELLIVKIAVSL